MMSSINFMGSYSGIDRSTIDQLMEAEKIPLISLANKKSTITMQNDAWKDINTRLNTLFEKIKALQDPDTYSAKTVKSTNENTVSMIAGNSSIAGEYRISVETLASSSRVVGGQVAVADANTALNKSGDITIANHEGTSLTVAIEAVDTLNDIASKINDGTEDTGLRATIIDKRIVIEDTKAGNRTLTVGGVAAEDIGLGTQKTENAGTNAKFSLNGIQVERMTNNVSDVIEGVTINLRNTHEVGQSDTVTIGLDSEKTTEAVKAFVDQYNSTMTFIEEKMAAGNPEEPGSKGILSGDSSLKRLHSSLRQMITSTISNPGNTDITDISQIGVKTLDRYGALNFNETEFKEALEANIDNVKNFFSSETAAGDPIGFSHKVNDYIDSFISKTNGLIKGKSESFERRLKDIGKQIDNFTRRIERKEEYYIRMFSALDVAMMEAENQMSWLSGQISAMNAQSNNK